MSELQVGLLGVGAVVVAAVFLYNKWQERRYRRAAEAGFASRHEDVLMRSGGAGQGVEPMLGSFDATQDDAGTSGQELSEILDFIVPIEAPEEVSAATLLGAAAAEIERCSKLVFWEGFDEALASWEPLNPERSYLRLRSGMQLVDRRGATDAEELAAFGGAIERAAASVGALATVSDPAELQGTQLAGLAEAAGFRLDEPDGKFRLRDEAGRVICALANFEPTSLNNALSTRGVTLELDVPRTPYGAFARFRDSAQMFARGLNARIVDDNREPVGPAAFDAIGTQLQAVHGSMEARGIAPGGALALRLFS